MPVCTGHDVPCHDVALVCQAQEAAGTDAAAGLTLLGDTINNAMQRRMSRATERLQARQSRLRSR